MAQQTPSRIVRQATNWSTLLGVSLVILGFAAVASPFFAAVVVNAVIAWLIVMAGVLHLILAFHAFRAGSMLWKLLVGLAYLVFGGYLIAHPALGVASLTLVLASMFFAEGVLEMVLFFQTRSTQGSSWLLVDGIITLLLGLMIFTQWPSSSAWAIGTLVGVSLIVSGVTRIMLSRAVRKVTDTISPSSSSLAA